MWAKIINIFKSIKHIIYKYILVHYVNKFKSIKNCLWWTNIYKYILNLLYFISLNSDQNMDNKSILKLIIM